MKVLQNAQLCLEEFAVKWLQLSLTFNIIYLVSHQGSQSAKAILTGLINLRKCLSQRRVEVRWGTLLAEGIGQRWSSQSLAGVQWILMGVGILVQHPWQNISFDITFSAFPELSTVSKDWLSIQDDWRWISWSAGSLQNCREEQNLNAVSAVLPVNIYPCKWLILLLLLPFQLPTKILVHPEESLLWGCCLCDVGGVLGDAFWVCCFLTCQRLQMSTVELECSVTQSARLALHVHSSFSESG